MKKFFYLLILYLFLFNSSYAQFSLGIKASAGASNALAIKRGEIYPFERHTPLFAYSAGISSGFLLKHKFEICTDVLFTVKRTKHKFLGDDISEKRTYQFISIPVYFNIGRQKSIGFSFGIINNLFLSSNVRYSIESAYNLGAMFGLKFRSAKKIKFSLEFQGDIKPFAQLSNFFKDAGLTNENDTYFYFYGLMFSVRYELFSMAKKKE